MPDPTGDDAMRDEGGPSDGGRRHGDPGYRPDDISSEAEHGAEEAIGQIPEDADMAVLVGTMRALATRVHNLKNEVIAYRNKSKKDVEDLAEEHRRKRRNAFIGSGILFVVLGLIALVAYIDGERTDEKFNKSQRLTCIAFSEHRRTLRDMISDRGEPLPAPPDAPPWVQEFLDDAAARGEERRQRLLKGLPMPDCTDDNWLEELVGEEAAGLARRAAEESQSALNGR